MAVIALPFTFQRVFSLMNQWVASVIITNPTRIITNPTDRPKNPLHFGMEMLYLAVEGMEFEGGLKVLEGYIVSFGGKVEHPCSL